jgi:hypothetical protein
VDKIRKKRKNPLACRRSRLWRGIDGLSEIPNIKPQITITKIRNTKREKMNVRFKLGFGHAQRRRLRRVLNTGI